VKHQEHTTRWVRQRQLLLLVPFSAATLWRRVRAGAFPQPTRFGRITAWRRDDVEAWLKEQEAK
jgi:predicted DNA-binding transcriptional regulator AlpA